MSIGLLVFSWLLLPAWAENEKSNTIVLPGRIQQQQAIPAEEERLQPIDPVPQWSSQKPVRESSIAQGAVVPIVLTSPLQLKQLQPGDLVEFETTEKMQSTDGHWIIPKGSKANAKVASWEWAQTGFKRVKLGLLFYEFVTPNGWVIPFEGYLLGMPKLKRKDPPLAISLAEGKIPAGGPGVVMFSLYPLSFHPTEKNTIPTGEVFSLHIGQSIYYGATLAYQDQAKRNQRDRAPDTGVVPVNYPHFSDDALQDIDQYQDDMMPLSPDRP